MNRPTFKAPSQAEIDRAITHLDPDPPRSMGWFEWCVLAFIVFVAGSAIAFWLERL